MTSRKTPVYFDPTIELVEIISAIMPHGMTLQGDGRGRIMVVRRKGWDKRDRPIELDSNVVPLRADQ